MSDYVLEVGSKGFDRLQFINHVFGEYSRNFLKRAGLSEGQRVLKIGCGTGSMTAWIAQRVGETGHVIAVDASEKQIEIASRARTGSRHHKHLILMFGRRNIGD